MCEVIGLDAVVPAAIISEVSILEDRFEDKDKYYSNVIITKGQVVRYSKGLKYTNIGRIVPNFNENDIDDYFRENREIFEQLSEDLDVYRVLLPNNFLQEKNNKDMFYDVLLNMISKINYSPKILRAIGICE